MYSVPLFLHWTRLLTGDLTINASKLEKKPNKKMDSLPNTTSVSK